MYCDENELSRLAIYIVIDFYNRRYKLLEHHKKIFKLSNNYTYKIKFNYDQYIYFNYKSLFKGSNVGLNKDNCDGYIIVYPKNSIGLYRDDFLWILIKTDDIIDMITSKKYICDEKNIMKSRYKFSLYDITNKGKIIL
jgi:hypothetical protein